MMYYIILPFVWFQAIMPHWFVRLQSRLLAFLLYRVIRYRRRVVRDNLTRCFPEKSVDDIRRIEQQFYFNFTFQILSSFKLLTYSPKQLAKHIAVEQADILTRLREEGHPAIILMMAHYGNWEYFSASQEILKNTGLQIYQIYRPLKNKAVDRLMHRLRERFGSRGIAKPDVPRGMLRLVSSRDSGETPLVIFIADQSPAYAGSYWTTFLGCETAFFYGPEKLSFKFSLPVVYFDVEKTGKDAYTGTIKLLYHPRSAKEPGSIIESYVQQVETTIRRDPSLWLWSHRRWKRPRLHDQQPSVNP